MSNVYKRNVRMVEGEAVFANFNYDKKEKK